MTSSTWIWVHNLNPQLLRLGDLSISWYWLFYPLGFLWVLTASLFLRKKYDLNIDRDAFLSLFAWGWVGLIAGGRVGYFLFYHQIILINNPMQLLLIDQGGMSFHGAILGLLASTWWWQRQHKNNLEPNSVWPFLDTLSLTAPIAIALGRVGNFINGELPGRPTHLPFGVIFPLVDQLPRHPSQLYQMLGEGVGVFVYLFIHRHKITEPGALSYRFGIAYAVSRWVSEFFREPDPQIGFLLGFTLGQWLCMIMLGFLVIFPRFRPIPTPPTV